MWAGVALRTGALPLAVRARAAHRAAVFLLAIGAGGAHHAVAFQLAVGTQATLLPFEFPSTVRAPLKFPHYPPPCALASALREP